MKNVMICLLIPMIMGLVGAAARAAGHELKSPDGRLGVLVETDGRLRYSVRLDGRLLTGPNPLSMTLGDGRVLGKDVRGVKAQSKKVKDTIVPPVKIKNAVIDDVYNELTLTFAGSYSVVFRAYDDGVAYRFGISAAGPVKVMTEDIQYRFAKDHHVHFPAEVSFHSHQERQYEHVPLRSLGPDKFCSIPMLVEADEGVKIAVTESDLSDYPGFYLAGQSEPALKAVFPAVAAKEERTSDRNVKVVERAGHIAETSGPRLFPWRVMVVARTDARLITSEMVYKLGRPCRLEDTSWIRPGKVAWDWYNANNLFGVDFRAGINTETYKFYIDFASKYGIEYVILDEGWYPLDDVMKVVPAIDMEALLEYAREKNVGLILWVTWKALDDQFLPALDKFAAWGVKGIKVDFMQRDDQWMVNYYERVLVEAAKRKLLVDFHGSYKPSGFQRTYPNFVASEGVQGNEHNKWSDAVTPRHTLTIPFIRMLAGPMDFTPGAMRNAQKKNFRPIFDRPMSLGTRCRQLAMYVLYESPLQMLCDSPSLYLREGECMEFLGPVPTVWDRTLVLEAKIGERLIMARRSGEEWYIGGMAGDEADRVTVDFSFLGEGEFTLTLFEDGINADRWAEDYRKTVRSVSGADRLEIGLAPGGGFAGRLVPKR